MTDLEIGHTTRKSKFLAALAKAGMTSLLVGGCGGSWGEILGESQNRSVFARLAVHFVDASPGWLFVRGGLGAGQGHFNFQAIGRASDGDAAALAGRVAVETMAARRDDGSLELQDDFIGEASGVGEIAGSTTDGGDEAIVGVQAHGNLMGSVGHGYREELLALASATSQASRHSGQ